MKRLAPEWGTLDAAEQALEYARSWYVDSDAVMSKIGAVEDAVGHLIEYLKKRDEPQTQGGYLVVPDSLMHNFDHLPNVISRSEWEKKNS